MKQITSIFLVLLLGAQCLSQLGVIAGYQLHKEYIIKTLCENKNKPETHCEGKCFLKKKLAAAEKSKKQASSEERQLEMPLFLVVVSQHAALRPFVIVGRIKPLIANYTYITHSKIFHPPSAVLV